MQVRLIFNKVDGEIALIDAWDEYAIDENYDGYEAAVQKASSEADRSDLVRVVAIEVPLSSVQAAFDPAEVACEVKT